MLPPNPANDFADLLTTHAKHTPKLALVVGSGSMERSDAFHLEFGKFSSSAFFSKDSPVLAAIDAVKKVLALIAKVEMVRVNAIFRRAFMQDVEAVRDCSSVNNPRQPVRVPCPSFYAEPTISVTDSPNPKPASGFIALVNLFQKPIYRRFASPHSQFKAIFQVIHASVGRRVPVLRQALI